MRRVMRTKLQFDDFTAVLQPFDQLIIFEDSRINFCVVKSADFIGTGLFVLEFDETNRVSHAGDAVMQPHVRHTTT